MSVTAHKLDVAEVHHMAMVVADLDEGMNTYSEVFGLTWADRWSGSIPILFAGETQEPIVSFTLS